MTRIYRYVCNVDNDEPKREIREYLISREIKYSERHLLLIFEIPDDREDFNEIQKFLESRKKKIFTQIYLKYSKKELNEAEYLYIWLKRYSGYPQPEGLGVRGTSYIDYTYDVSNLCTKCGSGLVQKDSFYLRKSFNIDRVRFGGVYWVYDTFFITAELRDLFVKEKITGIEFVPVKNIRTKQVVDHIVQLKVTASFPARLKYEVKKVIDCKACNKKRDLVQNGAELFAPKEVLKDLDKDFYLTQEFHGDGFLCCNSVLISKRVYRFFDDNKIRNINFQPIRFV